MEIEKRKTAGCLILVGLSLCIPVVVIVTTGVIGAPDWTENWELLDNLALPLVVLGAMLAFCAPLMLRGRSLGVRIAWGVATGFLYASVCAVTLYVAMIVFGVPIR